MSLRRLAATGCLALGLAGLGALTAGGLARADDTTSSSSSTSPAPTTATSSFTLPLFGAPLTISVSTNAGGSLTSVAVNPADPTADPTAVELRPNKVEFVTTKPGQSEIKVGARHGSQGVFAHTASVDNIVGPGEWSGDVFADDTAASKVDYEIVKASDGTPDITNVTATGDNAQVGAVEHHAGDKGAAATVAVTFTKDLRQRTLRIMVGTRTGEDGSTHAVIAVVLDHERSADVPVATAAGSHTWATKLCDGSDATISYVIGSDGALSNVTATPASATVTAQDGGTLVQWSDTESAVVSSKVDSSGNVRVRIQPRLRCGRTTPSVNTPTSLEQPGNGDQGNGQGNGDQGNGQGDQGGHHGTSVPATGGVTAGAKSWDGKLCDGSAAHIDFTLNADGTIAGVTATPTATTQSTDQGAIVTFAAHQKVGIAARLKDGVLRLVVVPRISCGAPSVSTASSDPSPSVSVSVPSGDGNGNGNGNDNGANNGGSFPGKNHGGDHHPSTSSSTTSSTTATTSSSNG